jgi:hypothetical protein
MAWTWLPLLIPLILGHYVHYTNSTSLKHWKAWAILLDRDNIINPDATCLLASGCDADWGT